MWNTFVLWIGYVYLISAIDQAFISGWFLSFFPDPIDQDSSKGEEEFRERFGTLFAPLFLVLRWFMVGFLCVMFVAQLIKNRTK